MQINSQKLIPAHINFSSEVSQISSAPAPSPGSRPSGYTENDKLTISGVSQGKSVSPTIPVTIGKCQWEELDNILAQKNRGDLVWIGKALINIERAIAGGPGSAKFVLNDDGSYSGEEAMQNFIKGAINAGDQQNAYFILCNDLAGKFGSGEKDLNAFTSFAAQLSSEDLQIFMKTYQTTPVTLTGEYGRALMDFAAGLSGNDMKNFLIAVHNSPDDLQNIIATGSKLSEDDLSNFLAAAKNAKKDIDVLTDRINGLTDQQNETEPVDLTSYLSAAAKTGMQIIDFIKATSGKSSEATDNITNFINNDVNNRHALEDTLVIIKGGNEETINNVIAVSSQLGEEDKNNLLHTAARAGNLLVRFVQNLSKFTDSGSSRSAENFSNFLKTATKAEKNLEILMKMSDSLDLAFTSELSAVDTVNFLDAAKEAGGQLDKLVKLGSQLSGQDKGNYFYAAAQAGEDLGKFLTTVAGLKDSEKSEFLLNYANNGQEENNQGIYMKGLLTPKEYDNFQKSAAMVATDQIDNLVDITAGLDGSSRSDFLEIAAVSEEGTGDLTNTLNNLSQDDQEAFVHLAKGLDGQTLKKLIKAAAKTDANFSDFIALAKELKQSDKTEFGYFLSAAADASPEDQKELIALTNKIGEQQKYNNRFHVSMRHLFLLVASDAGHNLNALMDMAEDVRALGHDAFGQIFESAAAATGKHLGAFIQAYV